MWFELCSTSGTPLDAYEIPRDLRRLRDFSKVFHVFSWIFLGFLVRFKCVSVLFTVVSTTNSLPGREEAAGDLCQEAPRGLRPDVFVGL